MMKRFIDINTIVAFLLVLVITVLVFQFQRSGPIPEIVSINRLAELIKSGKVSHMKIDDNEVELILLDGTLSLTVIDPDRDIAEQLIGYGLTPEDLSSESIEIEYKRIDRSSRSFILGLLIGVVSSAMSFAWVMKINRQNRSINSP
jgi:hypothetical protein